MKKQIALGVLTLAVLVVAACGSSPSYSSYSTPPSQQNQNRLLISAIREHDINGVRSAIANGADINYRDTFNHTPLMYACSGVTINGTRYLPNFDIAKLLIDRGADVNLRNDINSTALTLAAANNQTATVKYLIEHGASINVRDNHGKAAVNYAYDRGEMEMYNFLLANGAIEF
jgi:ankyrin repeat protein